MGDSMRFLAINFGGIGDEILFLPALAAVRSAHPDWHLSLLVEPRSRSVGQITDLTDEIITFDIKKRPLTAADILELSLKLSQGRFDVVLSAGASPLVSILLYTSGIGVRVGYDSWPGARLLLTHAVPLVRRQYAAAMYADLAAPLAPVPPDCRPSLVVPETSRVFVREEFGARVRGTTGDTSRIVVHPGTSRLAVAKGIIKTWAASSWAALVAALSARGDCQLVLAGGPDDEEIIAAILSELGNRSETGALNLVVAAGRTQNLSDLAALIETADLVVCVDSAPMHIAVALGRPLVALFGPTDPQLLLPPSGPFSYIRCQEQAPTGLNIDPRQVLALIVEVLEAQKDPESSPAHARQPRCRLRP